MSDGHGAVDADLLEIERVQSGDEQGLVALMERHREPVFRFCYRFVSNEADALELTEETFVRVFQHAGRFRPRAKVATWIFSIAGNLCRDFLRRSKKRGNDISLSARIPGAENQELIEAVESPERTPEQAAVSKEALSAIDAAIASLPHKLKFPFIFCVLEEHSYDDCAEVLNTNRKTVEMRIYRARKALRAGLADLASAF
ncbi:sigma-70 family RNA polymerase sigma factor [Pelagicoccus sp. SDUM812005]|uniref:RNA polymerase sigma factor n=1 Tax=Pelagicoccus sp. SDUM812005 TaxID=3041257 RepID=UPI00280F55E2|nr:sigma-70 family RNA polymerase sigma factor [Pelagicoccus sp. SDUM812005]MDQ8180523.1 sigma-70 family RNA polymerase sigma factor [Pelagicoccus sp. SDUM812005]